MRILGIDPGLRITGYGLVLAEGPRVTVIEAGVIRIPPDGSLPHRLHQLHADFTDVITELGPGLVSVESVFSHPERAATGVRMGHARGVILLAAAQHGIEVVEHPPAQVKKALTGDGSADKTRMQSAIMARCGLTATPEPPDVADALAIALCAAQRLDTNVIPKPREADEPPR
ncbi:MAG: crossover junction endodeoxyribonuclease RuvC [Phycisphaerae bacterium]|nr:crossover junction endodeoxyribonuclease RuvC [Phycisphaerae bacterium]OUX00814.1 MAG: crossover junction endodeoxyribonuclease RuvC [Phycisphaeraceae bacterium TMED231]